MSIIGRFEKEPGDVQDYDVSFTDWLANLGDTAATATVTADTGVTLQSFILNTATGVCKVWLSGGVDGTTYKVVATLLTAGTRTKKSEILVKVKAY